MSRPPRREIVCREEGCDRPPLDMASFCAVHIDTQRRCKATKPGSGGSVRCRKTALRGLEVCEKHGGRLPAARAKSEKAIVLSDMKRFVVPYEGELDPIYVFEMEFRRTLGRIAWLEEQVGNLAEAKDLVWGVTKTERVNAAEFTGTNTTEEARVNTFEEMLRWERTHLMAMEKLWIAAKLDTARLTLMRTYVAESKRLVLAALKALGVDMNDPDVRSIVAKAFEAAPHLPSRDDE